MAGLVRASYTAPGRARQTKWPQSRPASIAALLVAATMLAGCSTIMMPLNGWTSSQSAPPADDITTGSIRKPTAVPPDGDGEVIRRAIETAARSTTPAKLEWSNPATGNSGTISEIVEAKARNGAPCRDFATTLATIEGVTLHRGRVCQGYLGPWELVDLVAVGDKPAG